MGAAATVHRVAHGLAGALPIGPVGEMQFRLAAAGGTGDRLHLAGNRPLDVLDLFEAVLHQVSYRVVGVVDAWQHRFIERPSVLHHWHAP